MLKYLCYFAKWNHYNTIHTTIFFLLLYIKYISMLINTCMYGYTFCCRVSLYGDTKIYFIILKCPPSFKVVALFRPSYTYMGSSTSLQPGLLTLQTCETHKHLHSPESSVTYTFPALSQLRLLVGRECTCQDSVCHLLAIPTPSLW